MESTEDANTLHADLLARSAVVAELDGPQIEAWVSGLFPLFEDHATAVSFVDYCQAQATPVAALICCALGEVAGAELGDHAHAACAHMRPLLPPAAEQIGASQLAGAWTVHAPFGRSLVLGFSNPVVVVAEVDETAEYDTRHSILLELSDDGRLEDLQLAGSPTELLEEAAAADDRVVVTELDLDEAVAQAVAAWPRPAGVDSGQVLGPGVPANQHFTRARLEKLSGRLLPEIRIAAPEVDVSRGLDDSEFAAANRAALSTLQAAMGPIESTGGFAATHAAWVSAIRGDAEGVTSRERDALLWLEWADWLGVGIGLLRAGSGTTVSGGDFVDLVNRCPEVSSTIDKADRDYAEWAFEVAIELLADAGVVSDGRLTAAGHGSLGPALRHAWSPEPQDQ